MTGPGLYSQQLLAAAARAGEWLLPGSPSATASARSPLCGDDVVVGVVVDGDRITGVGFALEACAVCRASAAILADVLVGGGVERAAESVTELESVVRGRATANGGPFAMLAPVSDHPNRKTCALLPWRALESALLKLRAPDAAPVAASEPLAMAPITIDEPVGDDALAALRIARDLVAAGESVAIATLVSVVGSSPSPIGSRMVIPASGDFTGSVSGGCVEAAVVAQAIELLQARHPDVIQGRLFPYRISNSAAADPATTCGGEIRVHLQQVPELDELDRTIARMEAATSVRLLHLATGVAELVPAVDLPSLPEALRVAAEGALADRGGRAVPHEGAEVFVEAVQAPPRLIMVGGTHIAQKLAGMARAVGFTPVIVDPRDGFANERRFRDVALVLEAPAKALPGLIDARAAVVTLTHKAEFDDPALVSALASDAFYVGALGSRKTQAERLHRLQDQGVPASQLARLHGPAGIPIGGLGAGEIALSILAEIVAARRQLLGRRVASQQLNVGAVVLAAGLSRRVGPDNKLLHPVDGEPMIRRTVRAVLDAGVRPVLVVLGHEADDVRDALADLPVEFVVNDRYADGIGSSVAAGIRAMTSQEVSASFVVLGDMPFIRPEDIARLAAVHDHATRQLIVVPDAPIRDGNTRRPGNPVLWPRRYFDELAALIGDTGGKTILATHAGAVRRVPIDHPGVLRDLDEPSDLAAASSRPG